MVLSTPAIIQEKCNKFVVDYNKLYANTLSQKYLHNGIWKESNKYLVGVADKILDT
ncbi:20917_t:CDS:1, partial [Dentiscutata erythropus]